MHQLSIYRKRFIPNELVYLKDDIVLVNDENLLVTRWHALHPRKDISMGISAYYMDKGIKISKIFDHDRKFIYWYCDIFQVKKEPAENSIIFEDLLVDVILYKDGSFRILDLNELADALDLHLITKAEAIKALRILDLLLNTIYQDNFSKLIEPINRVESDYSSSI